VGATSIIQMFVFVFVLALFLVPLGRIMGRAGWSPWMALLFPIPIVGIVLLWSFAFARWPAMDGRNSN